MPEKGDQGIDKAIAIKMASLSDLVRLAVILSSPQLPMYIIKFKHNGKLYLGILGVFRDYYKYYGLPIFYYYEVDDERFSDANYIVVSSDAEKIEVSKTMKPGLSIPLIHLAEKPVFIPDSL